jgi:SAM-dependent methyltransferase
MKATLKRLVPEAVRARVRRNRWWRRRYDRRHARELAATSKRLDICAAQFAHLLHQAGRGGIEGKVCLEVGSGWVLTHALVCHLLGAERVIATDVEGLIFPRAIADAVGGATPYLVRDVLSPFAEHSEIRARLERLRTIDSFDFERLAELGIEYRAPVDLARQPLDGTVDFIYSLSVLEHVPQSDLAPLVGNLAAALRPGGFMIHAVHLEDHRDIDGDPFAFLAEPASGFGREQESDHGNRLRRSGWRQLLDEQPALDWRFIYEFRRLDRELPSPIDPSVAHEGEDDLRVSHLGILGVKREVEAKAEGESDGR